MTTTITKRVASGATADTTKRVASGATADTTKRVATHGAAAAGFFLDTWGGAWGNTWGIAWFPYRAGITEVPSVNVTKRVTGV
jgi:hypothetical protein